MTSTRRPSRLVLAATLTGLAVASGLLTGGATAEAATSRAATPRTATSTAGWGERSYPVDCGGVRQVVRFRRGTATLRGFRLTATPRALRLWSAPQDRAVGVVAVTITCTGADSWPDELLVYRGGRSPRLLGTAVAPRQNLQLVDLYPSSDAGLLYVRARGWSPSAPHYAPDLGVVTAVEVTTTSMTATRFGYRLAADGTSPATGPFLGVRLTRVSRPASRTVTLAVAVTGVVPLTVDSQSGTVMPPSTQQPLGTRVDFGDGATDGSDAGDVTCRAGTPLAPLAFLERLQHRYARPGTYTVRFTTAACVPVGTVTRTLKVTVR